MAQMAKNTEVLVKKTFVPQPRKLREFIILLLLLLLLLPGGN